MKNIQLHPDNFFSTHVSELESSDRKRSEIRYTIEVLAYCTSDACNDFKGEKRHLKVKGKLRGVKKEVTRGTIFCPDCSHALFWNKV